MKRQLKHKKLIILRRTIEMDPLTLCKITATTTLSRIKVLGRKAHIRNRAVGLRSLGRTKRDK